MLKFNEFQHLNELAYKGNIGVMEMVKFHQMATPEEKKELKRLIDSNDKDAVWDLVTKVTGVKLHRNTI